MERRLSIYSGLAWESSWHFATQPLVSPRNDVWETRTEIPSWLRITAQIWVVLLIGCKFALSNQKHHPHLDSDTTCMVFLRSFLGRHFAEKPVPGSVAKCRLFSQSISGPTKFESHHIGEVSYGSISVLYFLTNYPLSHAFPCFTCYCWFSKKTLK